jgi:hypothetical protein
MFLVLRVHWLRARSQNNRWQEEIILINHEMEWTVRFFLNRARLWKRRHEDPSMNVGPMAYAARQQAQYESLAKYANYRFGIANREFSSLVT